MPGALNVLPNAKDYIGGVLVVSGGVVGGVVVEDVSAGVVVVEVESVIVLSELFDISFDELHAEMPTASEATKARLNIVLFIGSKFVTLI
ncbi:hypothetical protein [Pedobacter sp. SYP-B3415]|uniref:hypothetical protein n=1 Tax=Pedobacter sp. SYP-B3415 TaxID=2496641 RepID=UPI00101D817C|nr:hypothetical protein [Pedobacter sp. SYP-B3415]